MALTAVGCRREVVTVAPPPKQSDAARRENPVAFDVNQLHVTSGAAPGYVNDSVCAACHQQLFDSYQHVGMARSFARPSKDTAIEDFGNSEFFHPPTARYYEVKLDGDDYVFRRYQLDEKRQPINVYRTKIDWVLGSGNHARTYLTQTDAGELYQLPVAWYSDEKRWAMAPGFDNHKHVGLQRHIERDCMFCHNAYPEVAAESDQFGSPPEFPREMPHGIGCQRCHGPGAEHVKAAANKSEKQAVVSSIVNPARLEPDRREDVCNACHLQPSSLMTGVRKFGRADYSFQPGEALSDYLVAVDVITEEGEPSQRFEKNHHAYRLRQSRCFTESNDSLSCVSCHDPHRQVAVENRAKHYRDACFKCHNDESCSVSPDEHSKADLRDCVSCHMPRRRAQDFVHVTMTDHLIQRGLASENLLDPLPEKQHVIDDVVLYDPETAPTDALGEIYRACAVLRASSHRNLAALERLSRLLELVDVAEVEPYLDLATAQAKDKRYEALEKTLTRLLVDHGDNLRARQWLALALIGQKNRDIDARKQINLVLQQRPDDAEANYHLGLLLFAAEQYGDAVTCFEKALAARPSLVIGWYYLGNAYAKLGRVDESVFALRRALEIEPGALSVYPAIQRALTQAGQTAEGFRYSRHEQMLRDLTKSGGASGPDSVAFQEAKDVKLIDVVDPELDRLEKKVAEQIQAVRESFQKIVERPNASRGELGQAYGELARIYHAYELYDAASACYLNAARLVPGDHRWPHLLGTMLSEKGQLDLAVPQLLAAAELNDQYEATRVRLGDIYLQLGKLAEAREQYEKALRSASESAAARFGLGQVALAEQDFAAAAEHFQNVLSRVPAANRVHYSLAMAYRGLGDTERANEHLKKRGTVGLRPVDPLFDSMRANIEGERLHLIRGRLAFNAGRFQEAFDAFTKAVAAKPDSSRAHVNLGTTLTVLGKPGQAIVEYQEALEHDPDNFAALYNLGFLFQQSDDFDESIKYLNTALKLNPDDISANRVLAASLVKSGRQQDALRQYRRVLEVSPTDEDAVLGASVLLQKNEEFEEAIALLSDFQRRLPDHQEVAHVLAKLLATCPDLSLRDGQRAANLLKPVYDKSRQWEHLETLAQALAEAGKCDEAAEYQRQLIAEAKRIKSEVLVERLGVGLRHYEAGPPCRPTAETIGDPSSPLVSEPAEEKKPAPAPPDGAM